MALDSPTPETQQEVIRLLIDHIIVDKDAITIKHIIPTDDNCRLLPGRRWAQMNADWCKSAFIKKISVYQRPIFRTLMGMNQRSSGKSVFTLAAARSAGVCVPSWIF
jgi:hypothetical protein